MSSNNAKTSISDCNTAISNSQQRLAALDGLRGVAVLIIIFFHTHPLLLSGGFLGVDIFFVLSGFLITSLLLDEFSRHQRIGLGAFYARRFLRLMPALALLLCTLLVVYWIFATRENALSFSKETFFAATYTTNLAVAFEWYPLSQVRHTWSLAIEEQFYLLWPPLLYGILRCTSQRWLLLGSCILIWLASVVVRVWLTLADAPIDRLYCGLDTRADALMAGAALGVLVQRFGHYLNPQALWLKGCWLPAVAVLVYFMVQTNYLFRELYLWQLPLVHIASALLILNLTICPQRLPARLLGLTPILLAGRVSYGAYLWHVPVLLAALHFHTPSYALLSVTVAGTFVLAAISYILIERPCLKFKKCFKVQPA